MEGPIRTPEELGTPLFHGTSKVYREYDRGGMLKRLGEAALTVHPTSYPDDELDIGPSNAKGLLTLFACAKDKSQSQERVAQFHPHQDLVR